MNPLLIAPEICISLLVMGLFVLTLFSDKTQSVLLPVMTKTLTLLGSFFSIGSIGYNHLLFWESYQVDVMSQVFKCILCIILFILFLFYKDFKFVPHTKLTEFAIFLSSATLGMMMLTSAVEILTFYIALELVAYSSYVLVPMRNNGRDTEAAIKYIIFGATTSGILLYGLSLLMGLTQTMFIADMIHAVPDHISNPAFLLALFMVMASLMFKLSAAPFHFWAPDVYEAAPLPTTTFIATASKAAATVILLRFASLIGIPDQMVGVLGFIAFISMTLGNTAALLQNDLKRLMAYSSVAQAGYIFIAVLSNTSEAFGSIFFYVAIYAIMNLGAFIVLIKVGKEQDTDNPRFEDLNGLADRSPLLALLLLVCVLSLAGIPPLAGFTGKWFMFQAAMIKGHWFLVLWAVINSVISLFYYLNMVKHAYLMKAEDKPKYALSFSYKTVSIGLVVILVLFGIYPQQLLSLATAAF